MFTDFNLLIALREKITVEWGTKMILDYFEVQKSSAFKGTVSREKLLNCSLRNMDWTLTIDRTWVLHFPDQLFNCYNILTVCRLDVKPVWWLSTIAAFRRLHKGAVCSSFVLYINLSLFPDFFPNQIMFDLFYTYILSIIVSTACSA